MDTAAGITLLISLLSLFRWLLFARIILSWVPGVDWYSQPFRTLYGVTEPVMAPLRNIIPPLGGIDLSPILLFFGIDFLTSFLSRLAI